MAKPLTYADSGVDIEKANEFVQVVKKIAKNTPRNGVMGDIGGFGGLFSLNASQFEKPILVSSTDGVGTKLMIAIMAGKHDTVGIDLVAMSVNDIAMQGAKPLFFLDYLAMGKLDVSVAAQLVEGVAEGCRQAACPLIGGETAEMPDLYREGDYDLAGFAVGIADNSKIIDGSMVGVGNQIIGVASSGIHANGYSLVREVCFNRAKLGINDFIPELNATLSSVLLAPTRIYSETISKLIRQVKVHGLANITGGGLVDNIPRTIPQSCKAVIRKGSWPVPPIFGFLQKTGEITEFEMLRTFNNGVGFVAVVPKNEVSDAIDLLHALGEKAWLIGEVSDRKNDEPRIIFQ
ncbi:MAG: phosphoribosylformylglycinamidine cyclo-ligase [Deltaproteobacteria bacterium]|nr:phosphoribosylformylglycinamidine cyclo-ligase [Deltaproteobacteria bacterium]